MAQDRPPAPADTRRWTRIEDYLVGFGWRKSALPPLAPRTQPEEPRFILSTLPFLLLTVGLFAIAVTIMVLAWPGREPAPPAKQPPPERGVAPRGWLDDAKREFHR